MNGKTSRCLLTKEDVEIAVKRAVSDTAKVVTYCMKTYSDTVVGFLGSHRHLVVTVQKNALNPEEENITFFVKAVPYGSMEQASLIEDSRLFFKETNFYNKLMPELLSSIMDKSWSAHCYLVKDDLLLFEDLTSKNFTLKDKFLGTTLLKSALSSVAKLHAASILTEKRLGRSLLELYPEVLQESLFAQSGKFFEGWFTNGVKLTVGLAKHLGFDNSKIHDICYRVFDKLSPSKTRRNVVCHGDAWSFNLMFDDTEPLPQCVLVDFQLVRYVPPTTDILQMLYLTTDREYREKNEKQLLTFYHKVLCETLADNDAEIELPKLQDVLDEYEELRLVGEVTAALYYPISLLDGKKSAELVKDSSGFANLFLKERVDLVISIMDEDPHYKERIKKNIEEIVEHSEQLLS